MQMARVSTFVYTFMFKGPVLFRITTGCKITTCVGKCGLNASLIGLED